jgi:hypothetical protein
MVFAAGKCEPHEATVKLMEHLSDALKAVVEYVRVNVDIMGTSGAPLRSPPEVLNRQDRVRAKVEELEQLAERARTGTVTLAQFEAIREERRKDGCTWPQELTSDVARNFVALGSSAR